MAAKVQRNGEIECGLKQKNNDGFDEPFCFLVCLKVAAQLAQFYRAACWALLDRGGESREEIYKPGEEQQHLSWELSLSSSSSSSSHHDPTEGE